MFIYNKYMSKVSKTKKNTNIKKTLMGGVIAGAAIAVPAITVAAGIGKIDGANQITLPVNSTLEIFGASTPESLGYEGTWEFVKGEYIEYVSRTFSGEYVILGEKLLNSSGMLRTVKILFGAPYNNSVDVLEWDGLCATHHKANASSITVQVCNVWSTTAYTIVGSWGSLVLNYNAVSGQIAFTSTGNRGYKAFFTNYDVAMEGAQNVWKRIT